MGPVMARRWRELIVLAGLLGGMLGAPPLASAADMISGRAQLPERVELPAAAVFEAALVDLSALDAAERLLGSLRIDQPGAAPIRFAVPFDRSRIRSGHRYAVRAVVRVDGALAYRGEAELAANGHWPASLLVSLHPVEAGAGASARTPALAGSEWRLTELDGKPVAAGSEAARPSLLLQADSTLSGFAGCNRLNGRYEWDGTHWHTGALATTRMACPPAQMALEAGFLGALAAATSAQLTGSELELRDASGRVRLRLQARPAG